MAEEELGTTVAPRGSQECSFHPEVLLCHFLLSESCFVNFILWCCLFTTCFSVSCETILNLLFKHFPWIWKKFYLNPVCHFILPSLRIKLNNPKSCSGNDKCQYFVMTSQEFDWSCRLIWMLCLLFGDLSRILSTSVRSIRCKREYSPLLVTNPIQLQHPSVDEYLNYGTVIV